MKKGTTIHINVSKGLKPVAIPDETGQPFAAARSALKGLGFTVVKATAQSPTVPKGQVVSEDPQPGTQAPAGSTVTVTVSTGPGTTPVPDVSGQTTADATTILQQAGFVVSVQPTPVTDPSLDGSVISQDPIGGNPAAPGSLVTITVGQLQTGTPGGTTTTATTTTTP